MVKKVEKPRKFPCRIFKIFSLSIVLNCFCSYLFCMGRSFYKRFPVEGLLNLQTLNKTKDLIISNIESNFNFSDLKGSENECSKPTSKYKNFSFSLRLDWINKIQNGFNCDKLNVSDFWTKDRN